MNQEDQDMTTDSEADHGHAASARHPAQPAAPKKHPGHCVPVDPPTTKDDDPGWNPHASRNWGEAVRQQEADKD